MTGAFPPLPFKKNINSPREGSSPLSSPESSDYRLTTTRGQASLARKRLSRLWPEPKKLSPPGRWRRDGLNLLSYASKAPSFVSDPPSSPHSGRQSTKEGTDFFSSSSFFFPFLHLHRMTPAGFTHKRTIERKKKKRIASSDKRIFKR